jgi:hypothetical protein
MTSTNQLERWCQDNKVQHFQGVFASNELPKELPYEARLIVNYSPSTSAGTHWLAFIKRGETGYWFDSMGQIPDSELEQILLRSDPHFHKWLYEQVSHVHYNHVQEEALRGDTCGQYACWFVKHGPVNGNPAWSWLSGNLAYNDEMIQYLTGLYSS